MGKIAIVTDSNSGITQDQARELGISVIPMPFYINEKLYLEGITLSQEEFYERLKNDEAISTSQPGPADVCGLWNTLLEKYDEVVHIPMSIYHLNKFLMPYYLIPCLSFLLLQLFLLNFLLYLELLFHNDGKKVHHPSVSHRTYNKTYYHSFFCIKLFFSIF